MKKTRWAGAAVTALITLTGCTTPTGDVAAVVSGIELTGAQLETANQAYARIAGVDAAQTRATVLSVLIRGEVANVLMARHGITITAAERERVIASDPDLTRLAQDPAVRTLVEDAVDINLVGDAVGRPQVLAEAVAIPIVVNPRYGGWSTANFTLDPELSALARPATSPAPSR